MAFKKDHINYTIKIKSTQNIISEIIEILLKPNNIPFQYICDTELYKILKPWTALPGCVTPSFNDAQLTRDHRSRSPGPSPLKNPKSTAWRDPGPP